MKTSSVRRTVMVVGVVVVVSFGLGYLVRSCGSSTRMGSGQTVEQPAATAYTCSMHPQIHQPKPGKCPICGMELIPVKASDDSGAVGLRAVHLSPEAEKLAEIVTVRVERKMVPVSLRLVGKISYDESRLARITARTAGRIDKLYVDFTGMQVRKGDHLVQLYSQPLYVMQAEYLIARKSGNEPGSNGRDRLLLAGMNEEQVKELERSGAPQLYIDLFSPLSGTVVEKQGVEGSYIDTGFAIYSIADLSRLWLMLDAYESDLQWIRYGQPVTFTVEAYSDITFTGMVTFISPVLNEMTRTVSVRVNVDNAAQRLKPGFFVNAVIQSSVAAGGKVMTPAMANTWVCPMHPDVIKTAKGICDICKMDLVPIESLGFKTLDESTAEAPLVIPASAPLLTGTRAVVYVASADKPGVYEGREITLGPRAGNYYIVRDGLREGELVVSRGAFKIDSVLQIEAKTSMMNPPVTTSSTAATTSKPSLSPELKKQLSAVLDAYYAVQKALAADNLNDAKKQAATLVSSVGAVEMQRFTPDTHMKWMDAEGKLKPAATSMAAAAKITDARTAFEQASNAMITLLKALGAPGTQAAYRVHCPMAADGKGADWLQPDEAVKNPYFGAEMPECGEVTETIK